jgi:hypothetical protein
VLAKVPPVLGFVPFKSHSKRCFHQNIGVHRLSQYTCTYIYAFPCNRHRPPLRRHLFRARFGVGKRGPQRNAASNSWRRVEFRTPIQFWAFRIKKADRLKPVPRCGSGSPVLILDLRVGHLGLRSSPRLNVRENRGLRGTVS